MAKSKNEPIDPLFLLKSGASQKHVATALGVDQSQVSWMYPGGIGKAARDTAKYN